MTLVSEEVTLEEFILRHPEIQSFELLTTREFSLVSEALDCEDVRVTGTGSYLDSEYSYIGGREGALEFSRAYNCFEGILDTLDEVSYFSIRQTYFPEERRIRLVKNNADHGYHETHECVPDNVIAVVTDLELYTKGEWLEVPDGGYEKYEGELDTMRNFLEGHPEIQKTLVLRRQDYYVRRLAACNGGSWNAIMDTEGEFIFGCSLYGRSDSMGLKLKAAPVTGAVEYGLKEYFGSINVCQRIVGDTLVYIICDSSKWERFEFPELVMKTFTTIKVGPFDDNNKPHHEVML